MSLVIWNISSIWVPKPKSPVWSKEAVTNLKDCTVAWRQIEFTYFTHKHQLLYLVWACMGCEGWPKHVTLPSLLVCPFHIPRRWGNTPLMALTLSLVKEWVRLTVCWHRQVAHSVRDGNMVFDRGWKGNRKLLIPDNIQCSLRAQQQKDLNWLMTLSGARNAVVHFGIPLTKPDSAVQGKVFR